MDSKKSKPVTTSVPSISIKFHANAEEIEELRFSDDETANSEDKNNQLGSLNPVTSPSDQDSSPLKIFGGKLVKRSTSVDVSSNQSLSSSPPSDPWRFFSDIKGKITKSVEEKITEIKARHEESSPLHKAKNDKTLKDGKTENKDSSSFSDSEEQSESSLSKTCGLASTTEGVEMSSDDETSSLDKDKKLHSPNIIRQKFKFFKHHSSSHKTPNKEGTVNINHLSKLYNINTEAIEQALPEHTEDVESAVDALEETDFKVDSPDKDQDELTVEIIQKVSQKIDNIEVDYEKTVNIKEVSGDDVRQSFFSGNSRLATVFAPTGFVDVRARYKEKSVDNHVLSYVCLSIYIVVYAILHTYLSYLAGLMLGASLAFSLGYVYVKLFTNIVVPVTNRDTRLQNKILEIPAIKEHLPVCKIEGWVNEYPDTYDPLTYHISQTQSVFLRLQSNILRLSHSKCKIPKRAMWNEHEIKASFSHHRLYNLVGAKISLLPEGLAKIRLWSKKYPICITLNKDQMNFDPAILKETIDDDKDEQNESPKLKKKFMFKKREYPYMSQRFSKLADQDVELESDSRASTPSPELSDPVQEIPAFTTEPDDKLIDDDDMHSIPDDSSECSQNENSSEVKIYLFGRTDREKECWFRRLAAATHAIEETSKLANDSDSSNSDQSSLEMEYLRYMTLFKAPRQGSKPDKLDADLDASDKNTEGSETIKSEPQLWFNALVGRVLFDCIRDPGFTKKVQNRIQKKLQTIKLPYFIEEILIAELSLGKTPPFIVKTDKPIVDERGLWLDLDISYEGSVVLTLQTKLNLMRLKNPRLDDKPSTQSKSAIYHSDVDDSAESSSDEDGPQEIPLPKEGAPGERVPANHGSKKFIKMVDRIAESKFFQAATENRYIKKAMEGVSNTELRLTVELKALSGTVVLNIPPPPSDRIWVGFRPVPELVLTARPIVGDRNVTYTMVTSWIEKKMLQEFQKVMVIPNMEDFLVPVMNPKLPE